MKVYWRGRLVEAAHAVTHLDWDLFCAGALAESLQVARGRLLRFADHYARLREGAQALGMRAPERALLERACRRLLKIHRLRSGSVRVRCFRDGSLLISAHPAAPLGPLRVATTAWRHAGPDSLTARAKTSMMLAARLSLREQPWADEALRLTPEGLVAEGAWRNLVLKRKGRWFSPPAALGLLEGTALARRRVTRQPLTRYDLYTAEQVWMLNALGARPVVAIDGRILSGGQRAR